jgi:hypothetical protein
MPLPFERLHDSFATTLTAAITTTSQTTISVAAAAPGWAASGPFRVRIDGEALLVTGGASTTTWTVIRGAGRTTKATHSNGATLTHVVTDVGLGAALDSARPTVPSVARFNAWGIKFRGVTPEAGFTTPSIGLYGKYWGSAWNQALVDQQIGQAVQVGANHIKSGGSPWEVIDGTTAQATHLSHIEYFLDQAWKNSLFVSFAITDNIPSPNTSHRGTLAEEITQGQALAALLDQYPNVVALDVINEVNTTWQVGRGGPGTNDASQPDATSVAWIQGPDSLTAALRAVTSKPLGYSLFLTNSTQLLANTGADWLPLLVANCDYLDLHPYWPSTSDMPLADLESLHALYPQIAVYFGEVSVYGFGANTPEVKRRIESSRAYVEKNYVPGLNIFTLDDWEPVGTGIFDTLGNERTNMSYPFRTLPRRAGYSGPQTATLIAPSDPFPLSTVLTPVPSAKFPLKASFYDTTLGDPSYRIFAVIGEGIQVSDSIEAQVYDLDTNLAIVAKTVAVPTTGGPTTPDSSSLNNPGSVVGGAATGTGKFSNGVVFTSSAQQIQWPNLFQPTGTQPFTAECWFKRTRTNVEEMLVSQWTVGGAATQCVYGLVIGADNRVGCFYVNGSGVSTWVGQFGTLVTDTTTFHHAMVAYDGTTIRFFLDGTLDASNGVAVTSLQATPANLIITASGSNAGTVTDSFQGTIDEVRISNIARQTAAFTPPAAAYTSDANTMLLAHMDSIAAASSNITATLGSEWQYVPPNAAINAGVKFRNATAARGAVLAASLEVRYA